MALTAESVVKQIHEVEKLDFSVQMVDHWTDCEYKLHDLYMSKLQELKKAYKEVTGNEYAED